MRAKLTRQISYLLVLFLLAGGFPFAGNSLHGDQTPDKTETSKKKKRKKPSSKKKRSSKKKKSSPKKKKSKSSKRKKSSKKKKSNKKKKRKKPTSKKKKSKRVSKKAKTKRPTVSAKKLSGELFDITESLNTSSRKLARATRYLNPVPVKKAIPLKTTQIFTLKDLEKAALRNPNDYRLQRELALQYERNYEWTSAKDIYLRLVSQNPQNPDYHYYLGSLYHSTGELTKSKQAFEEAIDLDPNHKATLESLAVMGHTPKKKKMKEEILLQSSKKNPDGPAQRISEIQSRIDKGLYEDAARLAGEAEKSFPQNSSFVLLHGNALRKMGEYDQAKSAYKKAILMDVKNQEAYSELAELYYDQEKYIYAAISYGDVVRLDHQDVESRYMQGLSYFKADEWGRAASSWEDLLHYQPNNPMVLNLLPQAYYILAIEYNRTGNPALSRTSFDKALSVNSNSYEWLHGAMRSLGHYYREKDMHKESLSAFQEVIELRPKDASAYLGIGVTYWKMGEYQLAKSAWERSLELKPDNNEAKGWLIIHSQKS